MLQQRLAMAGNLQLQHQAWCSSGMSMLCDNQYLVAAGMRSKCPKVLQSTNNGRRYCIMDCIHNYCTIDC